MSSLVKSPSIISKAEKWLEAGYEMFAVEGSQALKVERLARLLNLNKSGFYHHFGSPKQFQIELFKYHGRVARQMALEIPECKKIDPDFFVLIVKYKWCFLFQGQLLRRSNFANYEATFLEVTNILDRPLLPLWCQHIRREDNMDTILKYFNLFRDQFYARANGENMSYMFLHNLFTESEGVIKEIVETTTQPNKALPGVGDYN
jgi:AcrR family transcriptional regulator